VRTQFSTTCPCSRRSSTRTKQKRAGCRAVPAGSATGRVDAELCHTRLNRRVRVTAQISLSLAEREALRSLAALGVEVTMQAVPSVAAVSLEAALRRVSPAVWDAC
jgi:mannose/fructose/N-acetylgalactosamine-specific phosphotransferase system component IIB